MKRLVILGGGTAGTMVANKLRAAYSQDELALTVVDLDDQHHYQPGYLFLPFGTYRAQQLVRSRHSFLPDGVDLVLCEIDRVDAPFKTVYLTDGRALSYDYLIIATGVQPRPEATTGGDGPEVGVSVHSFYTLEAAKELAEALRRFRGGKLVVHITDMPIKCPVAPLEFTFLAEEWLTKHGIREKTELTYVTPLDGAFTKPVASRELGTMLSEKGIHLETDFTIERIDNDAKEIVSYDDRRVPFDLLVTIPLNLGPDYIARSGLGDDLNLVPCDQQTMQALAHPDIFVLGDGGTLLTSKAGSVAHFAVDIFMENFPAHLAGAELTHGFDGHANCFIESGYGKGLLLGFNYDTQPYTGTFPAPLIGPLALLKESRLNHLAKLAFRWVYWNMLLRGRPLPFTNKMSLVGKRVEDAGSASAQPMPAKASAPAPLAASPKPAPVRKPAPARPSIGKPAAKPSPTPRPSAGPATPTPSGPLPPDPRKGVDSTTDPSPVLPGPIKPTF
ncbi:MAG: FAD-dependent oxidoreductase [Micropruina sp.]|nr:FAD-dependent oxidoreductase [Micropruina sp.]